MSDSIGAGCTIHPEAFVPGGVTIGDRVTVERGAQLCAGVKLEDDVYIGPQVVFADGSALPEPPDRNVPPETVVRTGASIGANATVLPGVEVGFGAKVGAGSVVTQTIPPHAKVIGNPAHIQGYTDSAPSSLESAIPASGVSGAMDLQVQGVRLQRFSEIDDLRGKLTVCEMPNEHVPFTPQRWFLIYDVPSREIRGEHAHRVCHQFLVCVSGEVHVALDDGRNRAEVLLDEPTAGLYVPPYVWASQYRYDEGTVLLVLASHPYDSADYIREYDEFLAEAKRAHASGGAVPEPKS